MGVARCCWRFTKTPCYIGGRRNGRGWQTRLLLGWDGRKRVRIWCGRKLGKWIWPLPRHLGMRQHAIRMRLRCCPGWGVVGRKSKRLLLRQILLLVVLGLGWQAGCLLRFQLCNLLLQALDQLHERVLVIHCACSLRSLRLLRDRLPHARSGWLAIRIIACGFGACTCIRDVDCCGRFVCAESTSDGDGEP